MRLDDAPEHDCPTCVEHPILVYQDSVGPSGFGSSMFDGTGTTTHYYICGMCGGHFHADGAEALFASQKNNERAPFQKKCDACDSPMRVGKIAVDSVPPPSGPRTFGGTYNRVETSLVWRCTKCGTTEDFKHADVLGFN